ncbi:ShKT domain-containing protein [Caenorhabditis elegans]|nr:ShKT domain-containing protein [Caenorhabditis elegans]CTQ86657.1 ShKT domain-containing protein [Caenorhabditis elegans]|eukprot:NP_001299956.1 Mucin Like Gene [Caenorhabditis elegans]
MCKTDVKYQKQCPYTCGTCVPATPDSCFDHMIECPNYSVPCTDAVKIQCPKRCGVCTSGASNSTLAPPRPSPTPPCFDSGNECATYTLPCDVNQKIFCPRTCGVCGSTGVPMAQTTLLTTVKPTTTVVPSTTTKLPATTTKKLPSTTPKPPCKDSSPNCAGWAKNGFCTNTFYPPEKRKEYCAKTCRMC